MIQAAERNNVDLRMELALALYTSKVFDVRKSAEIAGVLWRRMDEEIAKRGIEPRDVMTPEEFKEEWTRIKETFPKE